MVAPFDAQKNSRDEGYGISMQSSDKSINFIHAKEMSYLSLISVINVIASSILHNDLVETLWKQG